LKAILNLAEDIENYFKPCRRYRKLKTILNLAEDIESYFKPRRRY